MPKPIIAGITSVIVALSGCASRVTPVADLVVERDDIHERLMEIIKRDGFEPRLHTVRHGSVSHDSIFLRIGLDGLKRRHPSVDKMIKDVGKTCALQKYSQFPIRIEIGAKEEDDREYLFAILATVIRGVGNINVISTAESENDVTVVIFHPSVTIR